MVKFHRQLSTAQRLKVYKYARENRITFLMCIDTIDAYEKLYPKTFKKYNFSLEDMYLPNVFPELMAIKPKGVEEGCSWFGALDRMGINIRRQMWDTVIIRTEYKLKKLREKNGKDKTTA